MFGEPILDMKNQPHCKIIIWEGLILNKLTKHSLSGKEKSVSPKWVNLSIRERVKCPIITYEVLLSNQYSGKWHRL